METTTATLSGINDLVHAIEKTNQFFLEKVQQQVNSSLTLRNWMIGHYLIEYEQNGKDRAKYGENLYDNLAKSYILSTPKFGGHRPQNRI
jgi:hypothetical protein